MRKFGVCLALTGATVWLTGCGMQFGGQPSSSRGGIAVVDLDKVAAETGKAVEMKEALQIQENGLKQQLSQLQLKAKSVLEAKAEELKLSEYKEAGREVPDDVKRNITQVNVTLNNQLRQAQTDAGKMLTSAQQTQLTKFRAELKPILHEAAAKRGLSVVIPKNDGLLLTVDPGVDITDDVIKAYAAKRPTPGTVPAASTPVAPAATQTAAKPEKVRASREAREAREARESGGESSTR